MDVPEVLGDETAEGFCLQNMVQPWRGGRRRVGQGSCSVVMSTPSGEATCHGPGPRESWGGLTLRRPLPQVAGTR